MDTKSPRAKRSAASTGRRAGDDRPPVAVGHVFLAATDVGATAAWLQSVGLRSIFAGRDIAVLEFRGGTHVVVSRSTEPLAPGSEAPFDLMVDDIQAARRDYAARGFAPSRISRGRIHNSFQLAGPDGYAFTVVSSHTGGRAV